MYAGAIFRFGALTKLDLLGYFRLFLRLLLRVDLIKLVGLDATMCVHPSVRRTSAKRFSDSIEIWCVGGGR